jgi:hypothetical protein
VFSISALNRPKPLRLESQLTEKIQTPLRTLHLLYHELRPSKSSYSYVVETGEFEKHVDLFVGLRKKDGLWPELTFDDGHISNFELAAPILQSRGLSARFFITAGWTGKRHGYMGWTELRALHARGHPIGAHGWTHKLLTQCDKNELEIELSRARLTLEDKLGTSITTMSLPGGRFNRRVLSACKKSGYVHVYTSVPKAESAPLGNTIGRVNIRGDMQSEWILDLFRPDGDVLSGIGRQYRLKAAAKVVLRDRLYEKLWALMNRKESDGDEGEDHTG